MLWSLGFAALTGVGAILLQGENLTWRVVGTGLVTAAAAGLLMGCSKMVDHEKTRAAGLLGMCAVIVEFVMALLLIWQVFSKLFGVSVDERLGFTVFHVGLCAPAVVAFLAVGKGERTFWVLRVGVVLCVSVLALLLVGTWLPGKWSRFDERWWETAGDLALYGVPGILCLIDIGTRHQRWWRWLGVFSAAAASATWLWDIWIGSGTDLGYVIFISLSCGAAVATHASLIVLCHLTPGQRWVVIGTIASAVLTAGLISMVVADEKLLHKGWRDVDFLWRCMGASGILAGCGTLTLIVLARLNRQVDFEFGISELVKITLICPRCRKKQNLPIGDERCVACDLRISTRIEEPRCTKCGYLLYKLTSDRCPECGEEVGSRRMMRRAIPSPDTSDRVRSRLDRVSPERRMFAPARLMRADTD